MGEGGGYPVGSSSRRRCDGSSSGVVFDKTVQLYLLLLKVPPVFFVHQNQVQKILDAELVVDVLVGGRQVVRRQENPVYSPHLHLARAQSVLGLFNVGGWEVWGQETKAFANRSVNSSRMPLRNCPLQPAMLPPIYRYHKTCIKR